MKECPSRSVVGTNASHGFRSRFQHGVGLRPLQRSPSFAAWSRNPIEFLAAANEDRVQVDLGVAAFRFRRRLESQGHDQVAREDFLGALSGKCVTWPQRLPDPTDLERPPPNRSLKTFTSSSSVRLPFFFASAFHFFRFFLSVNKSSVKKSSMSSFINRLAPIVPRGRSIRCRRHLRRWLSEHKRHPFKALRANAPIWRRLSVSLRKQEQQHLSLDRLKTIQGKTVKSFMVLMKVSRASK